MNKKIFALLLGVLIFIGCEDVFEPPIENILEKEFMYEDPTFAVGFIANAYLRLPSNGWKHTDVATDNAVNNDPENFMRRMATGQWTSQFNPVSEWQNSRASIQYLNLIIEGADQINWASDADARLMYADRFKGEAHALRAFFNLYLLQYHAGYSESGELLGIPIITEFETADTDFNVSRDSFEDCMQFIYNDLDIAAELLPVDFAVSAIEDELYLNKYQSMDLSESAYERVFGPHGRGRMTRRIVEAIRSRATLLAASEAFSAGNNTTWENAAVAAGTVLERIGGVDGIDPKGHTWFSNASEIDRLGDGANPDEVIWRTAIGESNALESENLPPSIYGNGRINPSQNFVNAFPMVNGYPIDDPASGYESGDPYADRDPRLAAYVILNNSTAGVSNTPIITAADGPNEDALNRLATYSTRTGYYLRKLLRMDVNIDPSSATERKRYRPHFRYTEIFLNYAEAANEAWGPDGSGSFGFSAYDVVKAIRTRAGIGVPDDPYLESVRGDQVKMRELIRNERRIELSFEDFRFLDLRRWKADINEPVRGVSILNNEYSIINVESRPYEDYMYYGPIPYNELLKYEALEQNRGW